MNEVYETGWGLGPVADCDVFSVKPEGSCYTDVSFLLYIKSLKIYSVI